MKGRKECRKKEGKENKVEEGRGAGKSNERTE